MIFCVLTADEYRDFWKNHPQASFMQSVELSELKKEYTFTEENAMDIILKETGKVFEKVLEDAGVYKNTEEGYSAFRRFIDEVNKEVNE